MEDTSFQRHFEPIPPAIAVRDVDASMKINKMRVSECQMEVTADHDAQSEYYQADDCCGSKSTTSDDSSCGKMKDEDTDNEIQNDMDKTANDESGYDASTGSEKHSKIIRHENGHLSLANCIYSDLPGQHLDNPSPFCSDLSSFSHSSAGSWPGSSKSLQGDSGVSSEDADSYLQPTSQEETSGGNSNQSSSEETNSTNSHAVNFECLDCENGDRISGEENEIHNSVSEANTYTNPIIDGTNTSPQLLRQSSSDVTLTITENTEEDKEKQNVKNSVGKDTHCSVTSPCSLPRKTSTTQEEIVHKNYSDNSLSESLCEKYSSCRWKFAFLCFLARFFQSSIRQCMGIAVIGMTVRTALGGEHIFQQATSNSSGINITVTKAEFEWSSAFEGAVLMAYNLGSVIAPIIVGYLATRFGGRRLMTVCLISGGVFTILLPVAARVDPAFIIVFRMITGVSLSGTDSLIQAMLARWAPLYEKASMSVCAYTGLSAAGVLTFLLCGYIMTIGGEGKGWPYVFYIFGTMCLFLAPLWFFGIFDSPDQHPRITKKELAIIALNKRPEKYATDKKKLNIPWLRVIRSPAVWVVFVSHVTHKWVLSFMLSFLPRYFSDQFGFDVTQDGLFSSLPFAGRIMFGLVAGNISDLMIRKGASTARTRKFFQATGCWSCAICSLLIASMPFMSNSVAISLLILALSFQDLTSVAFRVNLLDIAPRYAGVLNGVVFTAATVMALPSPLIISMLVSGGSREGWRVVLFLVAGLNITAGALFILFAKGEVQEWAMTTYGNRNQGEGVENLSVFTLDSRKEIQGKEEVGNGKILRVMRSLPASAQKYESWQKDALTRRATFDTSTTISGTPNKAISNLTLPDM